MQTYGSGRDELFFYHSLDKFDIFFRNNFDNLFSFHNCSEDTINNLKKFEFFDKIKNKEFILYNGITYTETLKRTLLYLKNNGYTHVIYIQDDSLSIFNESRFEERMLEIEDLLDYFKNENIQMLNLEYEIDFLCEKNNHEYHHKITKESIEKKEYKNLEIVNTTSIDFKERGLWSFDDGAYIANIDFLFDNLYDNVYFQKGDIWSAENYLNQKWSLNKYTRNLSSISLYRRFNIVGRNSNRNVDIQNLNNLFLKNLEI